MDQDATIIILGAGLTGLVLGYELQKRNISFKIVEARDRIGGRIHTLYKANQAPLEMGATWLGKKHSTLIQLLEELEIPIFEQHIGSTAIYEPISTSPPQLVTMPENEEPSFRIAGGSSVLVEALAKQVLDQNIFLQQKVTKLIFDQKSCRVITDQQTFDASKVISTLPPNLFATNVHCTPAIPEQLMEIAKQTHTWMGESIKIALTFDDDFWNRKEKISSTLFSNVGPVSELYDHSNIEKNKFGLKGFMNGGFHAAGKAAREKACLTQLNKYYGAQIEKHSGYEDCVWRNEEHTFAEYEGYVLPHQNNGHQIYQKPFMGNRLFIAGSETAQEFSGYMDGAVGSALSVLRQLL